MHQKARGLRLTPHQFKVKPGATQQITAIALDQFSHPMRVVGTADYSLFAGSGSIDADGLFTGGKKKGKVDIQVMIDDLAGMIAGTVV